MRNTLENALNESRMLVLGAQVLIGFQYQAAFQARFQSMPPLSQYLDLGALFCLLTTLALLIAPALFHQITEEGRDTESLLHFANRVMELALLPFAIGIGIDVYIAATQVHDGFLSIFLGVAAVLFALSCWYGWELMEVFNRSRKRGPQMTTPTTPGTATSVKDMIKDVLVEIRVVLPGAQALLGFQFVGVFTKSFETLPAAVQQVHLVSLLLVIVSTILLMAPAAYHRIVEQGQDTASFHHIASRLLITATAVLALGISGDVFVVVSKVSGSVALAGMLGTAVLAGFYGLWFGYSWYQRVRLQRLRIDVSLR